jgi:hypothetical protein
VGLRHSVAVTVVLVALGSVAACGGSEPKAEDAAEPSGVSVTLGTHRGAPLQDPCQWLSIDEATEAMDRVGTAIGSSGVGTVTNATSLGDVGADCWYMPREPGKGRLVVTLLTSKEAATNWRRRMEDLAAQKDHEVDGDQVRTLTRVADAPTLQQSSRESRCDVHALIDDATLAAVELAVNGASDGEAFCSEAKAVLATVIERLPDAD